MIEEKIDVTPRLVTMEDLRTFKSELLREIEHLIQGGKKANDKQWLKSHEVRKLLNISSGKLLTLRINGTLPYTRIGGVIYYDQEDIQKMFDSHRFQHPSK